MCHDGCGPTAPPYRGSTWPVKGCALDPPVQQQHSYCADVWQRSPQGSTLACIHAYPLGACHMHATTLCDTPALCTTSWLLMALLCREAGHTGVVAEAAQPTVHSFHGSRCHTCMCTGCRRRVFVTLTHSGRRIVPSACTNTNTRACELPSGLCSLWCLLNYPRHDSSHTCVCGEEVDGVVRRTACGCTTRERHMC